MKNVYINAQKYKDRITEDGQYIVASFNGYGIGKMLFERTKEELKALGYDTFVCNCLTKNPTMDFYSHMGGEKINEFLSDIHGEQYSETTFLFKNN